MLSQLRVYEDNDKKVFKQGEDHHIDRDIFYQNVPHLSTRRRHQSGHSLIIVKFREVPFPALVCRSAVRAIRLCAEILTMTDAGIKKPAAVVSQSVDRPRALVTYTGSRYTQHCTAGRDIATTQDLEIVKYFVTIERCCSQIK